MKNLIENSDAINFLKTLDNNSVNAVITDPPYAISRDTNFQSGELTGRDTDRFRVTMDFGEWDVVDSEYFKEFFKQSKRVMKPGSALVCFYDKWKMQELSQWAEEAGFRMLRMVIWEKTNPVPINRRRLYLTNAQEFALVCVKGSSPTYNMEWLEGEDTSYSPQDKGVFKYPICHDSGRFHPTQKPLALMRELIRVHTNQGDIVVDPFAGSGTTLLAAKEEGRFYLGCEKDKEYFNKLKERLDAE